ncbi:DUF805 domain-containing protein [Gymnodinialimonas hymeniacidonis]|uniref:DUF805 domain-containing protein n=1 Tax=Gymnodinialimonas hymeniacidonis TaxID=3126508 RepID=UPI0034C5B7A1
MFDFFGRARRAEYWWFFLWQTLLGGVVGGYFGFHMASRAATDPAFATMMQDPVRAEAYFNSLFAGYEWPIFIGSILLFYIPNLSVTIRRLHDTDRSGWRIFMPALVAFISAIGGIVLTGSAAAGGSAGGVFLASLVMTVPTLIASIWFLVWLCQAGTNGPNRFGPDSAPDRKQPVPAHPAFAPALEGEAADRSEVARKAAARDYYKRHVLPSVQGPQTQ